MKFVLSAQFCAIQARGFWGQELRDNCANEEEKAICENFCSGDIATCLRYCATDVPCQSICIREYNECLDECPCYTNCPDGCLNCPNPVCGNSPTTSPTDNPPTTPGPGKEKLLILSTIMEENRPVLADLNGEYQILNDFEYDINTLGMTSAYGSCSAVLNGRMLVFGGDNRYGSTNQVSEVRGCALTRIGSMPVNEFDLGACNTVHNKVWLCFANPLPVNEHYTHCMTYDGSTFTEEKNTNFPHQGSSLGIFNAMPVAIAGRFDVEVETYDGFEWLRLEDYPATRLFEFYSTLTFGGKMWIFGGYEDGRYTNRVTSYNGQWNDEEPLLTKRHAHRSVFVQNQIFHVAGKRDGSFVENIPFEIWTMEGNGNFTKELSTSELTDYKFFPETFIVSEDFCN